MDAGEECDQGAANSDTGADACRLSCLLPTCGDGVTDAGEQCDAGAMNSDVAPDTCRADCLAPRCGDGVADAGEECDQGGANSDIGADACRLSCLLPACGDGVADAGEQCDAGAMNSDVAPDTCRTDCLPPRCGDGVVDAGEECDGAPLPQSTCTACAMMCDTGWADCAGTLADGCETNLMEDTGNCGWCGRGCAGLACQAGLCEPKPIHFTVGPARLMSSTEGLYVVDVGTYAFTSGGVDTACDPNGQIVLVRSDDTAEVLASGLKCPGFPTHDAGYVYWASTNEPFVDDSTIYAMPREGGAITTVRAGYEWPLWLTAGDDGYLYFFDATRVTYSPGDNRFEGDIVRLTVDGSSQEVIAAGQVNVVPRLFGERVYWESTEVYNYSYMLRSTLRDGTDPVAHFPVTTSYAFAIADGYYYGVSRALADDYQKLAMVDGARLAQFNFDWQGGNPNLQLGGDTVYFSTGTDLYGVRRSDDMLFHLATQSWMDRFEIDDAWIYWPAYEVGMSGRLVYKLPR